MILFPITVSNGSELMNVVSNDGGGEEIVARGGTYNSNSRLTVTFGDDTGNHPVIRAVDGENPSINFGADGNAKEDRAIQFRGTVTHFRGFEVSGSEWNFFCGLN